MDDVLEMSIDDILLLVKKVIYNAVKSGEAKSGDYFLLDDDGVYIGDPESFDVDVLFYIFMFMFILLLFPVFIITFKNS